MKAFILVNTELGREAPAIEALEKVEDVSGIYIVYGVYDLIVEVEAESQDALREVVFNKVRRLEQVRNTITLLTYGEPVINV